jgi:hypothetical protein
VRFRGEIYDGIDVIPGHRVLDFRTAADIPLDEMVGPRLIDVRKVFGVPRIGQLVEIDNGIRGVVPEHVADKIAPDETAAARDKNASQVVTQSSWNRHKAQ